LAKNIEQIKTRATKKYKIHPIIYSSIPMQQNNKPNNYFVAVPDDIITHLIKYLEQQDIVILSRISKQFRTASIPSIIHDNKSSMSLSVTDREKIRKFILNGTEMIKTLPGRLTDLLMDDDYKHPLPDPLPARLKSLTLNYQYNYPLPGILPCHLTSLKLGAWYCHALPGLPAHLQDLTLGWNYGHRLPDSLLDQLTSLTLDCYNHPLPGILPEKLTITRIN
jgi:hypothetical protein